MIPPSNAAVFRFHSAIRRPGARTYFKFRLALQPIERILVNARTLIRAVLQVKYKDYPAWNASGVRIWPMSRRSDSRRRPWGMENHGPTGLIDSSGWNGARRLLSISLVQF